MRPYFAAQVLCITERRLSKGSSRDESIETEILGSRFANLCLTVSGTDAYVRSLPLYD